MIPEINNQILEFSKTKTMFNMKSIRFLLFIINAMLSVISVILTVYGAIAYWHFLKYAFFYNHADMGRYITPSALYMLLGLSILAVSIFGLLGSFKKSTLMINLYAVLLFLLFIVKIVTITLAYKLDMASVWTEFSIPLQSLDNPKIQTEIDYLQRSLGCCGNSYYTDYANIELPTNMSSVQLGTDNSFLVLPASCCAKFNAPFCVEAWPSGCKNALLNTMENNITVLRVLGASMMTVHLMGIVFALILARCIRNMKSERTLMAWKIKEQIIIARQLEEKYQNEQAHSVLNVHHHHAEMA